MTSYMKQCINFMFKNQITLKINKRLKTDEQRNKLKQLKEDIFNSNIPIIDVLKKYKFKTVSYINDVKTKNNICYFNYRVDSVNKHIHKQIKPSLKSFKINDIEYWPGLEIVCKKHHKDKKANVRLYINYVYKIESIGEKFFVIKDETEDERMTLDIKLLDHLSCLMLVHVIVIKAYQSMNR